MKVTLNKANKIRAILENFTREVSNSIFPNETISLTGFEEKVEDVENIRASKAMKMKANLANFALVNAAVYALRNAIQKSNLENGINDIISQIAELNVLVREYSKFQEITDVSSVDLSTKMRANKEVVQKDGASKDIYGRRIPFADISVLDDEWVNSIVILNKNNKKRIMQLEEERNAKNHSVLIELPTIVSVVLTENDLI